jgi:hypothetical protein
MDIFIATRNGTEIARLVLPKADPLMDPLCNELRFQAIERQLEFPSVHARRLDFIAKTFENGACGYTRGVK